MADKIPTQLLKASQQRIAETGRLVLMYSAAPWGAGGGGQRPEQLAEQLARHALVVHLSWCNQNMIRRPGANAVVRNVREAGAWEAMAAPHRLAYIGMPDGHASDMTARLPEDWHVWYDCIDAWEDFRLRETPEETRAMEAAIVGRSSLVTATAQSLVDHVRRVHNPCAPLHLLVNSTRLAMKPWPEAEREVDCVFCGCLDPTWLHWDLIQRIAERHTVRMIGRPLHLGPDKVTRVYPFSHPNVEWTGQVPNDELMPLLATARVGIAPFANLPLCWAVWPIKYADYLAAGLPTVASYLPELKPHQYTRVAMNDELYLWELDKAVNASWDRRAIARHALQHTAEARAKQVVGWLTEEHIW